MHLKPKSWLLLGLLFCTAALCVWQAADRSGVPLPVSPVRSVRSDPSVRSSQATPAAPARSYHLSNTTQTKAQLQRNLHALLLRNADIDTTLPRKLGIPDALRSHGAPGGYLVQSDRPLNDEFYAALKRDGAEFVSYIPNDAALVRASAEAARVMVADPVFQAVLPYEPYFKLDTALLPVAVNGGPLTNNQLRVTAWPGQDEAMAQALTALGASVESREAAPFGSTALLVTVPSDRLLAVAQMPETQEIETFSRRQQKNDLTRVRLGVSTNTISATNYLGLTGTNITLVLDDTAVDATHPDLTNRVTANLPSAFNDPIGHGTAVAGTMIGDGKESATVTNTAIGSVIPGALFSGMASQANIYVQQVDLFSGPYISDLYLQSNASFILTSNAMAKNLAVTNWFINCLPWGYQSMSYDLSAAYYDQATRDSQPGVPGEHGMLFVVAAGNGGQAPGSITSPATAKNVITVGAIDNPRFMTNDVFESTTSDSNLVTLFSSGGNVGAGIEGPGGRFKPDVVAPGAAVVTLRSSNYQDPGAPQTPFFLAAPGQTVAPGTYNIYVISNGGDDLTGVTNLAVQVLPDAYSPAPFPTNLQIYFGYTNPPTTLVTATNAAGLPVVPYPQPTNYYISIYNPDIQPVNYNLNVIGIQTNNPGQIDYTTLSNLNNTLCSTTPPYYRFESGTSLSAGAVAGMLGLVQQYLTTTFPANPSPSPALLKALLINGSRPLNQYSDFNVAPSVNLEGWGLPYLANVIPPSLNPTNANPSMVYYDQSPTNVLQTGEWHQYTVTLGNDPVAESYPLRITLVWTDPPGNPAAGVALVNDLDLVVMDSTGTNVYVGNDFLSGDIYTEVSPSTNVAASDTVNNVENVYIDASAGLNPPYTIWVKGSHVNVNAVTMQTNVIGQDYALVIESDDPALTASLGVTDNATTMNPELLMTPVNNGIPLLHQRVGANEPNLYSYPGDTNGNPLQWHFFVFTNINYHLTNLSLYSNQATANLYSNAIFATFLPPTLTIPIASPVNESYQAAVNADLDMYVSPSPLLLNLDPATMAAAQKSVGQGGNNTVFFTNVVNDPVVYIGIKSESQQGGDFAFFATLATDFSQGGGNRPQTFTAYALPVAIPDSLDAGGLEGAQVLAFVPSPITVRNLAVTLGIQHAEPADLLGTLTHNGQSVVLNHLTGAPGGFTNTYVSLLDGSVTTQNNPYGAPVIPPDGPGTLVSFIGQSAAGLWRLNETDNAFTQVGEVTGLTLQIWPQPQNPLAFSYTLPVNGVYYGFVTVPDDATNLIIGVGLPGVAATAGIYLTNQEVPIVGDYGTNVATPGGSLSLSTLAALNLLEDPAVPNEPPLSGGVWYYEITNTSGATETINVDIAIQTSQTPNLNLTVFNHTPTPLGTDDHTQSQICITSGLLTSNQQLLSLQVGLRIADPNADDLDVILTSPQGTSIELFQNRGGLGTTNLGLTTSNGIIYLNLTDAAYLASQLIKFVPPPYGQIPTNQSFFFSSFETVPAGDYGQNNTLLAQVLANVLEGWTVSSNDVAVVTGSGLYPAYTNDDNGSNYLALSSGEMTNYIATIPGQSYVLTYAYRGPGLVDWWPFDNFNGTNFVDIIGTNNGTNTSGGAALTNIVAVVGQGIQFPSTASKPDGITISFGTNTGNFGTNDFTIDYWMNTTSKAAGQDFLEQRETCDGSFNFWAVDIGGGANNPPPGYPRFGFITAGLPFQALIGTKTVNDGLWHHLAWTRKGNIFSFYLDGEFNTNLNAGTNYNLSNGQSMIMGTSVCDYRDGTTPYTGAVDELDIWNRALTDVEIAAIFDAGSAGKATTTSILPNCEFLVNGASNTTLIAPASSTNWLTNALYFTATGTNTSIALLGNPLGMLFDDFNIVGPSNPNYAQPEEALAAFTGQNPAGCWTLDVWDTRSDSSLATNGTLLSWNLQMTVSSTNVNLVVLTNHVPFVAGMVAASNIAYFAFDVPAGTSFDTNALFNCFSNGSPTNPAPLALLFNQVALPTGTQLGDYTLVPPNGGGFTNVTAGDYYVLANDTPPPTLLPGARYFMGVQNTTAYPATFTIQVDTQVMTNTNAIALTNAIAFTNTITNAVQEYSFVVPPNAYLASFEIVNPSSELDLYAAYGLPAPTYNVFDYEAPYNGTNDEAIVVTTNFSILGTQVGTNSSPVPLTPGTWYLSVYNVNTNSTNTYTILATYETNGGITITPLTTHLAGSANPNGPYTTNGTTGGTAGPGPDLTNFYRYTVTNPAATGVQFALSNLTGNVDLIVRNGYLPTPQQLTDGSFNAGTIPEVVTIVTNASLPSIVGTTWYLGVPNNTTNMVSFRITALTLTNNPPGYTTPAVVFTAMSVNNNQFTINWQAVAGTPYQVNVSTNLTTWTNAATVTPSSTTGTYTDPAPVSAQAARFYQVVPGQ